MREAVDSSATVIKPGQLPRTTEFICLKNSTASRFGEIRYYEDEDIEKWNPELEIVDCFGIRTFWDLQQNQEKHADEDWQERMMRLELRVSQIEEYRRIAFFHHLLIKKKL